MQNNRLLRLKHIIGDAEADPPIVPIIPVSSSTWWEGVRTGRFPKPIKIGPKITVWRSVDIQKLLDSGDITNDQMDTGR